MDSFVLILILFGGPVLIFAFGTLIGHILSLDDYLNSAAGTDVNRLV